MPILILSLVALFVTWPVCCELDTCALASESLGAAQLQNKEADSIAATYQPRTERSRRRIEGGRRGSEGGEPLVLPLVPDHVGLTITSQPVLFWYLSQPTSSAVLFVLVDARSIEVVHDITLSPHPHSGVQRVSFKDLGISLERNVEYRWYITLVVDPKHPSRDIVSGGMIQRVQSDFDMSHGPLAANMASVSFYAENGLWYDAVASISDLISAQPDNGMLRKQRASLLQQVGLDEVAEWDLRQGKTE